MANAQYNLREFDEAEEMFERVIQVDPHRIEGIDAYSNILYVKEDFAKLAHLARIEYPTRTNTRQKRAASSETTIR